jgi:hypothetical protein
MIRLTLTMATVAVAVGAAATGARGAMPIGFDPGGSGNAARLLIETAARRPCALLTANDVAVALGEKVTWSSAGTPSPLEDTQCSYSTANGDQVVLMLAGARADFDSTVRQLQKITEDPRLGPGCQTPPCLIPLTKLSGVGDAAFLNKSTSDTVQVYVVKDGTFFLITLQKENRYVQAPAQATALARKVAGRIK